MNVVENRTVDALSRPQMLRFLRELQQLMLAEHQQYELIQSVKEKIEVLSGWRETALEKEEVKKKNSLGDIFALVLVLLVLAFLGALGGEVVFFCLGLICAFIELTGTKLPEALFDWIGAICPIIGAIGTPLVFWIGSMIEDREKNKRLDHNNRIIRNKNAEIRQRNQSLRQYVNAQLPLLRQEEAILRKDLHEKSSLVRQYFDLGFVYRKYYDLSAISSFYEYMESGRCSSLTGPHGAYNLYEKELRDGIIINKLDGIIDRLDTIARNQNMLYQAMVQCNRNLTQMNHVLENLSPRIRNIEANSEVSAYNSRMAALNSEFLNNMYFWKNF